MDKIKAWLEAIESSPLSIKKLLSSKKLTVEAIDATIAYVMGGAMTAADRRVFIEKVLPLLQEMDPKFTIKFDQDDTLPNTPFTHLDARQVGYRFDLDRDIPWEASFQSGQFFSPELLHIFGLDDELQKHADRRDELEWCWALTICRAFDYFEKDIIHKLGDRGNQIRPTKSSQLLIEEEVKHRKLFKRLAKILEAQHPERLELYNRSYQHPVCYEISFEDRKDLGKIEQHQYIIWLYTLFFEEFTVFLHEFLQKSTEGIQETWLQAHACHRREEQEHLLTAGAYLEVCGLTHAEMRSLSKEFFFAFERNYLEFFGLGTCLRYLNDGEGQESTAPLSSLPFFQEVLHHPLFEHTRTWAPVLLDLGRHLTRPKEAPKVFRKAAPAPGFMQIYQDHELNLIHALSETARKFPQHGIHIQNLTGDWQLMSYQELYEHARELAGQMSESVDWSQYVLIYFQDIYQTILGFWATLFTGRIPVVLAHASHITAASEEGRRLLGIVESLDSTVILTDLAAKADLQKFLENRTVPVLAMEDLLAHNVSHKINLEPDGDSAALLQFSSGSTGDPKGIVLSHRNVLANALQMILARQGKHSDRFLNWMPLHHDMGLIGFHITPLVLGADQYHITPLQFMKHPALWPGLVSTHRITHAGTTNTALKTLLRWGKAKHRDSYDLGSLNSLIIGAEPIEKSILDDMSQVFGPLGLDKTCLVPAFGMAEAALGVSFLETQKAFDTITIDRQSLIPGGIIQEVATDHPLGLALVCLGKAVVDLHIRIVDEKGQTLPERTLGFLSVKGPNVSSGYWTRAGYRPLLNAEGWYQTQDMGFLQNQKLFTVGRLQEVFFHSGKNYYLNDVDSVVEQMPEVRPGGCATIVRPDSGQQATDLIAFVDVIVPAGQDVQQILQKIHRHINQKIGVSVGKIVMLSRRHFMRTTSGKIKRLDMYRSWALGAWQSSLVFESGAPVSAPTSPRQADPMGFAVARIWSEILEQDLTEGHWDTAFSELGGTSLKAVHVHDALEQLLGKPLDPSWLLSLHTIRQQTEAISKAGLELHKAISPVPATSVPAPTPSVPMSTVSTDAIAIVAVGLRYPKAHNLAEFSRILFEGKQYFGPMSDARCRLIGIDPSTVTPQDRPYGSFLDDIDAFDNRLFNLAPGLAEDMDPQQRLLLEIAHAAMNQTRLRTDRIGVYVSSGDNEYEELIRPHRPLDEDALIGALANMVAAQISRTWHFHGPAMKVDTACSSSLYAVHLACQALKLGECDAAIAGGIQINLTAKGFDYFKAASLLKQGEAPAPFSDRPSGLVPGEGGGLVILKRYQDALRDHDKIYALIRGSGANNDGPSLSGTAPNPYGQVDLLQRTYQKAELRLDQLDYVEAHAAGTMIGDSIEVRALQEAWQSQSSDSSRQIALGSAKAFFGHCLSASGITSLIKVLAALDQERMPSTMLKSKLTPRIDFAAGNFQPLLAPKAWPKSSNPRRVGISSLGLGGTNVHIILEDPVQPSAAAPDPNKLPIIVSVGGATLDHYRQNFQAVKNRLGKGEAHASLLASSFFRDQFASYRRMFWSSDSTSLPEMAASDRDGPLHKIVKNRLKIAFVYPGPGSQYTQMGQFLYETIPAFREALNLCHERFKKLGFDLLSHMFDSHMTSHLMKIENSQPVVFAFSYALSRWMQELGLVPDIVVGHSAGEYAAAVQAGLMDLDSALHGILQRGRLMAESPRGGMAVVHLSADQVKGYLHESSGTISIAALNAPDQTTISGDPEALDRLIQRLEQDGHHAGRLDISCAAHSPAMSEAGVRLQKIFAEVTWTQGKTTFVSTVTDATVQNMSAEYWGEQLVKPVHFSRAIEKCIALGVDIFLELSPTSGLTQCISAIDKAQRTTRLSLLRRGQDSFDHTLTSLNILYSRGLPLCLESLLATPPRRDDELSTYLRQKFWVTIQPTKTVAGPAEPIRTLTPGDQQIMQDHLIQGRASAPFGLLMDMLIGFIATNPVPAIRDLVFLNSLFAEGLPRVRFYQADGQIELQTVSSGSSTGLLLAQAQLEPTSLQVFHRIEVDLIRQRCPESVTPDHIYEQRLLSGLQIGPSLRAIKSIARGAEELLVELESPDHAVPGLMVQAALIDSAMQATSALFPAADQTALYLGFGLELWQIFHPIQKSCLVYIRLKKSGGTDDIFKFDMIFTDENGFILAQMQNFTVKKLPETTGLAHAPAPAPASTPTQAKAETSVEQNLYEIFSRHLHRKINAGERDELFSSLGVDSLRAVKIANDIQNHFKIKLPATLLFECPNLKSLIRELERRLAL